MNVRQSTCALAVSTILLLAPGVAAAQDSSVSFHFSPWISTGFFGGDVGAEVSDPDIVVEQANINNAPGYGAFAGIRVAGRVLVEGVFAYLPSTMLLGTTVAPGTSNAFSLKQGYDLNIALFGGSVGYAFSSSKTAVVPYLSAGAGGISFSPDDEVAQAFPSGGESATEFMFHFGGGLEIPISDIVFLRVDARDYISSTQGEFSIFPSDESNTLNTILFSGGVSFRSR